MWAFVVTFTQAVLAPVDARMLIELGTIVFFGGAAWQQLRDLKHRVGRIEVKLFEGDKK